MTGNRRNGRPAEHDFCRLFIGGVSLFDTWLIFVHARILHTTEQNPVGRILLDLAGGGVGLFIGSKLLGTVLALLIMTRLWDVRRELAVPATRCVTLFQCWLLWYLCFANSAMLHLDLVLGVTMAAGAGICAQPLARSMWHRHKSHATLRRVRLLAFRCLSALGLLQRRRHRQRTTQTALLNSGP